MAVDMSSARNSVADSKHHVLSILSHLAGSPTPLTNLELAERTQLHRASVYRILESLVEEGWLRSSGTPRSYELTFTFAQLGLLAIRHSFVHEVALTTAVELCMRVKEPVSIGFYERGFSQTTEQVHLVNGVAVPLVVSVRAPAPAMTPGKILLAYQPPDEIERVARLGIPKYTPRTKTTYDEIMEDIHLSRERGFSFAYDEFAPEVGSFAVPIFDQSGQAAAALAVLCGAEGPSHDLVEIARSFAERASLQLGFRVRTSLVV